MSGGGKAADCVLVNVDIIPDVFASTQYLEIFIENPVVAFAIEFPHCYSGPRV